MGTICFLSKSQNFFTLPLAQKMVFAKKKKKREHSSYGKRVSFTMKSTIFTCKWLKEKGNDSYTYVSIRVYTYT